MARKLDIIPYKKDLVKKAQYLRKNSTPGEIELWKGLKGKQILGFDFDRQKPIHNYIVDFFCKELRLAIEIDGDSHSFNIEYDQKREQILNNLGVDILRFSETDAKHSTDHCLFEIRNWITRNPPQVRRKFTLECGLSSPMDGNSYTVKRVTKRFY